MKFHIFYHLGYSEYCLCLRCYSHDVDTSFGHFRCFMSNIGANKEPRNGPFIQSTVVDFHSINYDKVQVKSDYKYLVSFLHWQLNT